MRSARPDCDKPAASLSSRSLAATACSEGDNFMWLSSTTNEDIHNKRCLATTTSCCSVWPVTRIRSGGITPDERFGENLRVLRERAGMSQAALAEKMTERGISWRQNTVGRVEAGRQPARFAEIEALAEILHTSIGRFSWQSAEASATEMVYAAGARLRQRYEQVAQAVHELLAVQEAAERVIAEHRESEWERVREAVRDVTARLGDYSLSKAVAEGTRRAEDPDGAC